VVPAEEVDVLVDEGRETCDVGVVDVMTCISELVQGGVEVAGVATTHPPTASSILVARPARGRIDHPKPPGCKVHYQAGVSASTSPRGTAKRERPG